MTASNVYAPGNRPRCGTCGRELEPAVAYFDGEPGLCGFHPCPDHPQADVVYPLAKARGT